MVESLRRFPTGVEGLDAISCGGLIVGASYMIQGRPGSGKTILGNQIAYNHAAAGGRVLFVTLLSESHERLIQFISPLAFYDPSKVGAAISYVSAFETLNEEGLDGVISLLRQEIVRQKATLLVVDGVLNARAKADTELHTKRFIAELQAHAAFRDCTALLLTSARLDDSSPERARPPSACTSLPKPPSTSRPCISASTRRPNG